MHRTLMPALNLPQTANERFSPAGPTMSAQKAGTIRISEFLLLCSWLMCNGVGLALAQTAEGPERGQSIFRQHCMECHGASGRGDGVKAPFLSPRPGNLVSAATSAKSDKELLRTIAQGKSHTAMPAWQEVLSVEDQQAVLQYIRSLVRFTRSPAPLSVTP
jgi:mono/diheme cytochrome c family protein